MGFFYKMWEGGLLRPARPAFSSYNAPRGTEEPTRMTEDHDHEPGAPDGPTAGAPTPGRADLLGTTALTARVRCPCGRRQDLDREDWRWDGVAVCPACGRGLLHDSLRVVSRGRARDMREAHTPTAKELRALRRLELALRDFLPGYDEQPRCVWSPLTNRLADQIRRHLAELDEARCGRGAPPVVAPGPARAEAAHGEGEPDEGARGEDDEVFDDEADGGGEDSPAGDE